MKWMRNKVGEQREFDKVDVLVGIIVRLLNRDGTCEIQSDHVRRELNFLLQRCFVVVDERHNTPHGTFHPNMTDESPGIDVGNNGNSMFSEIGIDRFGCPPVTWKR